MDILLLRSARHLEVGIRALRDEFPGCSIAVVAQPGTERLLEAAGIAPGDRFFYSAQPFFTPAAFVTSETGRAVRKRRFRHVAVLWPDPIGSGYGNVSRTALLLAPRGFLAIAPDGTVVRNRTAPIVWREIRSAAASIAVGLAAVLLLQWPAAVLRTFAGGARPLRGDSR